jgi:inosine/xanthosine triphosphate pyrophosphatase family protein
MTTDLSEVIYGKVDQKFFISEDSKFLVNMLCVVPTRKEKDFLENYVQEDAKNDTQIVPGSAKFLELEDEEKNRIYRVILF